MEVRSTTRPGAPQGGVSTAAPSAAPAAGPPDRAPAEPVHWSRARVLGFGRAVGGDAEVCRPTTAEQVVEALSCGGVDGRGIALRGAGRSYGDASTNTGGRVLDVTALDRILDFDPETGIAHVQPGVRIRDLWRHAIPHGYWPAVVPGTMHVSMGGAAAMNIHGKNAYAVGTFGDHVLEFTLATPSGELLVCDRQRNADVFHAAIGGFGMLGCFTELKLKLKRVHSGRLRVWGIPMRNLEDGIAILEDQREHADYLVGWCDLHARGRGLGRGVMHRADQFEPGEDPDGERFLSAARQDVPSTLFGVVPKGWIWPGMWCAFHFGCVPFVNALKYHAGFKEGLASPYPQSHGAFHFLLDYVPRWHWMLRPGGLIQFQPFVPKDAAARVLRQVTEKAHSWGMAPYLGVLKRHRPDPFLMTHGLDGYSMAMDFGVPVGARRRRRLWELTHAMAEVVLDAGGRFYFAKDATLPTDALQRIHGADTLARFRALKRRLDPSHLLQTDLSRRLAL
ncbi:MAG: FAD-binding oxidoreductase [Planctomycetes bacterium]|nr:FAD-binding oxidoreductase [Planctomycetota bacterium]